MQQINNLTRTKYEKVFYDYHINGGISEEILTMAFAYLLRILKTYDFSASNLIQKLYATCVFLAHKFSEEIELWNLEEFSKMSKIDKKALFKYELHLFKCLNYKLNISKEHYNRLVKELLDKS